MAGKNQKPQHPNPPHTNHPTHQRTKQPCTRIRALLFQDPTVCHTINPITTNQHPFHTTNHNTHTNNRMKSSDQ